MSRLATGPVRGERWRALHGVLALVFALPLLAVALSGAMLGFARESDRMFNVDLLAAPASAGEALPIDLLLHRVRDAYPERSMIGLALPQTPVDALLVLTEDPQGLRHEVYIHPRSGELRGERTVEEGLYAWAWRLHTRLVSGEIGPWISRISALGLLLLIASGLALRRTSASQGIARAHPLLGLTSAPVLVIIAASGLFFMIERPDYGHAQRQVLHTQGESLGLGDPGAALAALGEAHPLCAPRWLAPLPAGGLRIACEEPRHAGTLGLRWLSWTPADGLSEAEGPSAGEWAYDLHTGELFGMPGRILWVMASLAIPLLILGGIALRQARRMSSSTR